MPKPRHTYFLFLFLILFFNLLVHYSFQRGLFYFANYKYFSSISNLEIFFAFLHGVFFDTTAIVWISLPCILFILLPISFRVNRVYKKIVIISCFIIHALFFSLNFIDLVYFNYSHRRAIFEISLLKTDWETILSFSAKYFWQLILLFLVYVVLAYFLLWEQIRTLSLRITYKRNILLESVYFILIGGCVFIFSRGFKERPMRPADAFVTANNVTGHLTLNSPYTVLYGLMKLRYDERVFYMDYFALEKSKAIIEKNGNYTDEKFSLMRKSQWEQMPSKPNMALFILEGMGADNFHKSINGVSLTPFLDSLMSASINFPNSFANGKRSIESLPCILASVPNVLEEPLILSDYETSIVQGIGNIFKQQGYQTSFFHGGKRGTMGFDAYAKICGMTENYAMEDYMKKYGEKNYDGTWGIYDGTFLEFFRQRIEGRSAPQFSVFFSLSTHHPFHLPDDYKEVFSSDVHPFYETVHYLDGCLKKFFESVKKNSFWQNTIFIFTADHTYSPQYQPEKDPLSNFRVPFFIYDARPDSFNLSADSTLTFSAETPVQHIDILPSIIDLLKIPCYYSSFGKSVFSDSDSRFLIEKNDNQFIFADDSLLIIHDLSKVRSLYSFNNDKGIYEPISSPSAENLEMDFKSYYQTATQLIYKNKIFNSAVNSVP